MPVRRRALAGPVLLLAALCWACGPSDPLERARVLQDERLDFAAPLESLSALLDERPDDPEVQYRYGLALLGSGQPTLALWPLQRAAESPEWETPANVAIASSHLATGSFERSIEVIDRELARDLDDEDTASLLLLRGSARIQSRRDYEGALADAERVLEMDPDNPHAPPQRAVALLALDRIEEAEEVIAELEAAHRDDTLGLHGSPAFCRVSAKFAEEKGETELAEERYDACLSHFPADGALIHEALAFYDGLGRAERSAEILGAAVEAAPGIRRYRMALAERLRDEGREGDARQLLREGTAHPEPLVAAEAWAGLARFLMQGGAYDEAIEAFGELRRLAGADDVLLLNTADALVIAGRYDEALAMAEDIGLPAYRALVRGRVALGRGEPRRALALFQEGIQLWPDNPFARYYAAVAAEQLGAFEQAIEHYRYAMRIDSKATDAYLRLARLQEAAGRPELALTALNFLAAGRPSEREAALLELRILARLGRVATAPDWVLQALGDPADRGPATAAAAEGVRARAGIADALETLRSSPDLDLREPVNAAALELLAELLAESGREQEALAEVERALRSHPEAAVFHALRGDALVRLGREGEARSAYQAALARDAEQRIALLGLARLESAAGATEVALGLYERALALDPVDAEAGRGAAACLAALERGEEAEEKLSALLSERPYDAEAAAALAELRLARGADDARTRELSRRAALFGDG